MKKIYIILGITTVLIIVLVANQKNEPVPIIGTPVEQPKPLPTGGGGGGILPFDSGIEGIVTLGPTCPVEKVPPDPNCTDRSYATTVQATMVGNQKDLPFATTASNKEGKYKIMLPPGEYTIQAVGGKILPRCESKNVTIEPSKIIQVNISCDTGIR